MKTSYDKPRIASLTGARQASIDAGAALIGTADPYNPYRSYVGSLIPDWLESLPGISHGAKLCYARLTRFAGKDGKAHPSHEVLGSAIGTTDRSVRFYLAELKKNGLINWKRRGRSNEYFFIRHPAMETGRPFPIRSEESFRSDRKKVSGVLHEENQRRESLRETLRPGSSAVRAEKGKYDEWE